MASITEILVNLSLPVSVLLKVTVILSVGWLGHFLLMRHNPRWRVLLWRAVMVGVILVPVLTVGGIWQIAIEPTAGPGGWDSEALAFKDNAGVYPPVGYAGGGMGPIPPKSRLPETSVSPVTLPDGRISSFSLWDWMREYRAVIILVVWVTGVLILAGRFFILLNSLRRKITTAPTAPPFLQQHLNRTAEVLGYHQKIELRNSDQLSTPFLYGLRRPVIVLPETLTDRKHTQEIPGILAHEVAHLVSHDLFWMLLGRWLWMLLWFHPLAWRFCSAHNKTCEEVCDGIAADYVGSVDLYSGTLARVALKMAGTMPAVGGVAMLRSANIVQRLRKLKRQIRFSPLARHWVAISLMTGLIALAGIGGVKLVYARDTTSSPQIKNLTSQQGTFEALVRHQKDKQPLALVQINVNGNNVKGFRINEEYVIFTDKNGLARIDLPPGDYVINVWKGYMRNTRDMGFNIVPNKVTHLDIYLGDSTNKTSGIVIDPQGRPVAGAWVRLVPGSIRDDIIWDHITDAQGDFELIYRDRQIERYIVARHPKTNRAGSIEFSSSFGTKSKFRDQGSQIKLEPGFTIKGKVTDPGGAGIAWAKVKAKISTGRGDIPVADAYTDAKGQYEIKALPTAFTLYYIEAGKEGYGPLLWTRALDQAVKPGSVKVQNIVLKPTDQSVSGVVVDAGGKPLAEAAIRTNGDGQPELYTTTDAQGKFTIEKVCKGKLRVSASKRNKLLFGRTDTEGGQKNIRITTRYNPQSMVTLTKYQKEPVFLTGEPLPTWENFQLGPAQEKLKGKRILLCFWDMNQPESKYYLTRLAAQAQKLEQMGVNVITVQSSTVDDSALNEWIIKNKIPFTVGMIEKDVEETKFNWGIQTSPWLIITDPQHKVLVEGFGLEQLDHLLK